MPEILTESFCERCGTRYTFQAAAAARGPLTRVRNLSKGFRNYVLSDEGSLSEAMATARSEELRRTSGEQLDAFHKAFNFCMSCRQYTCANCWNDVEGRCLSCSPTADSEPLAAPYGLLDQLIGSPRVEAANGNGHAALSAGPVSNGHVEAPADTSDVSSWPSVDLQLEAGEMPAASAASVAPADGPVDETSVADTTDAEASDAETGRTPADLGISAERFATMFGSAGLIDAPVEPEAPVAEVLAADAPAADEPEAVAPVVDQPEAVAAEALADEVIADPLLVASGETDVAVEPEAEPEAATEVPVVGSIDAAAPDAVGATDQIPDLEGWAASAAAQTSTLLNRFRAFPGKAAAATEPDRAADDAAVEAIAEPAVETGPEPVVVADLAPVVEPEDEMPAPIVEELAPEPVAAATEVEPEIELPAAIETEEPALESVAAAATEVEPAAVAEPGPSLEPIAAATEVEAAAVAEPEPAPEPIAAATEVEAAAVAEPEPAPEPIAATTEVEAAAVAEPEPAPEPAPAAEPVVPPVIPAPQPPPTPVWQMVAPDAVAPSPPPTPAVPTGQPAWPPLARQGPSAEPQWPVAPAWPARQSAATIVSGADAVWAASSRDLLNRPETGVQACVNCGLPLSARARFCRRCGTNQVATA